MTVGSARAAALEWVRDHAAREGSFVGAYLGGSTATLASEHELPASSDVDIFVVARTSEPPPGPGKLLHRGVLLEVTWLPWDRLASPEEVLGSYHLASGLHLGRILADPSGDLGRVQAACRARFAEPAWVRRRCDAALAGSAGWLAQVDPSAPWHDQVTTWLFGTGVTCHVLLVAALRNPTVRLRYLRARQVLAEHGRGDLYAEMLEHLGCAGMSPERAAEHLAALAETFDAAARVLASPYRFATDISVAARPIAIGGSEALIAAGDHREAVFWMLATFARCQAVLAADAPALRAALAPAFEALLADLGIRGSRDLRSRAATVLRFHPRLREAAEAILTAGHPG